MGVPMHASASAPVLLPPPTGERAATARTRCSTARASTARSSVSSSRRQRVATGATNRPRKEKSFRSSQSTPALASQASQRDGLPEGVHGTPATPGPLSVDRSAAFCTRRVPKDQRRLQMATWDAAVISTAKDWVTESQATLGQYDVDEEHSEANILDQEAKKREVAIRAQNKRLYIKARDKLAQLAAHRYGSIRDMFRQLDKNVDGTISLEEFSTAMKRRNLEKLFPREQQRIIFEAIDSNYTESLEVDELVRFLDSDDRLEDPASHEAIPVPKDGGVVARAVEQHGVSALRMVEKVQLPPNLRAVKDKIIDAIFIKTRNQHIMDGGHNQAEFLMNTFKQWDHDMSGILSPRELVRALGPQHLNLGLEPKDVRDLVNHMDTDNDGTISYKEFVRFLELTDIEPDFNPFFDHRNRELINLKKISEAPWQWEATTDDAQKYIDDLEAQRLADAASTEKPPILLSKKDHSEGYIRPLVSSQELVGFNETMRLRNATAGTKAALRVLKDSAHVFEDMSLTKQSQLSAICPRFVPPPPTDWARTGYGGDGIDSKSALFLKKEDRFNTTANAYFKPLLYVPNKPVSRDCVSDADRDRAHRASVADARQARTLRNHESIAAQRLLDEQMRFMNEEQKLKQKATEMLNYFKTTYEKDLTAVRKGPPEVMQRRQHKKLYTRMWGGSRTNMLHSANRQSNYFDGGTTASLIGQNVKRIHIAPDPFGSKVRGTT